MFQACRPAGRLFYLVAAVWRWGRVLRAACASRSCRGKSGEGKCFLRGEAARGSSPGVASPSPQSGPTLTSVIDTVYMADGTPAQGVLVITWPAFVTASGTGVAPGVLNVTLGTSGALNVALAAERGRDSGGSVLHGGLSVGAGRSANANIGWCRQVLRQRWRIVRTTPGAGTAAQPVSMQYVNSALAGKANDSAVVHLAGTETVTGTKTFSAPPNVPTPVGAGDVANKSYVDSFDGGGGSGKLSADGGRGDDGAVDVERESDGAAAIGWRNNMWIERGGEGGPDERVGADE